MELETILSTINAAGTVGLLALMVYIGYKGLVVPRSLVNELLERAERLVPLVVAETIRQLKEKGHL